MHNFIVEVWGSQHLLMKLFQWTNISFEETKGPEKAASNMHISNINNKSSQLKSANTETSVMLKNLRATNLKF